MTVPPITYDMLRENGASPDQLKAFRDAFGEAAPLTVEAAIEAVITHAELSAQTLLSLSARSAHNKARAKASAYAYPAHAYLSQETNQ